MNMDAVEEAEKMKKIFYLSHAYPSAHSSSASNSGVDYRRPFAENVEDDHAASLSAPILSNASRSPKSSNPSFPGIVAFPKKDLTTTVFISTVPKEASAYYDEHGIWEFRKLLSYWSIIFYMVGCFLFTIGSLAGFHLWENVERVNRHNAKKSFVTFPFVLGSTCFLIGGYISHYRVLNSTPSQIKLLKSKDAHFFLSKRYFGFGPIDSAYVRSLLYFVGSVFYTVQNWNKFIRGGIEKDLEYKLQVLLFLSIGSICHQIGSLVDLNSVNAFCEFRPKDLGWWSVWLNVVGCLFYQIGSHAGWITSNLYWTNLPYVIGSIVFLIASWFYLLVWKQEQWMYYHSVTKGYVSISQQIMCFVYIFSLTLSITVVVFSIARHSPTDVHYGLYGFCGIWLNVGLLQLSNSLAKVPKQKVQRMMLNWLRIGLILFTAATVVVAAEIYNPCFISCS